jgi:hypothetical protein
MALTGTAQNPRRRIVVINGSGGAQVLIQASGPCRYMEIQECAPSGTYNGNNYAAQGLNYQRGDEAYANTYPALPGEIITLGDQTYPRDRMIGLPAGMTDPAGQTIASSTGQSSQTSLKVISATATATQVMVREWL